MPVFSLPKPPFRGVVVSFAVPTRIPSAGNPSGRLLMTSAVQLHKIKYNHCYLARQESIQLPSYALKALLLVWLGPSSDALSKFLAGTILPGNGLSGRFANFPRPLRRSGHQDKYLSTVTLRQTYQMHSNGRLFSPALVLRS